MTSRLRLHIALQCLNYSAVYCDLNRARRPGSRRSRDTHQSAQDTLPYDIFNSVRIRRSSVPRSVFFGRTTIACIPYSLSTYDLHPSDEHLDLFLKTSRP